MAVKLGIRPIPDPFDQFMLDRIVMQVIHVPLEVRFIPNLVFPVSALPERGLAMPGIGFGHPFFLMQTVSTT